jgi:hypothetical protein
MKVLLLFLLFPASFCTFKKHKTAVLTVVNKGKKTIDSIKVRGYMSEEKFITLYPDSVYKRSIVIEPPKKGEGDFTIAIFQKDSIMYATSFGYFLNADWVRDKYTVSIAADYTIREQ